MAIEGEAYRAIQANDGSNVAIVVNENGLKSECQLHYKEGSVYQRSGLGAVPF